MQLNTIIRSFFKKGNHSFIKILSLGVGLAMGIVLIAKVYMDKSYDDFYPDASRIYQIQTVGAFNDDMEETYSQVSGAIAPGLKAEIPEVEQATRITALGSDLVFSDESKNRYKGTFYLADADYFDLFPRTILVGDPKDILDRPMYVMVSSEIAKTMGGTTAVVGKTIESEQLPGKLFTIGGVFEALPENTHFRFDVLISLNSIGQFMFDGRDNWLGNDRYFGYVKTVPGADPATFAPLVRQMQEKYQDIQELEKQGLRLTYTFLPLRDIHSGTAEAKRSQNLLAMLAFVVLFTAVMNYILIVISSLVNRSKEMAINKCYGASVGTIYRKMLSEAFVHLLVSLGLAALLIFVFEGTIKTILGASLHALFSPGSLLVIVLICLAVLLITGVTPGYLYSRIPVTSAFRGYNETRRYWKLGLLFIQFMAAGFLVTLLAVIGKQYTFMINDDPGYTYENLAFVNLQGVEQSERRRVMDEVARLPEVAQVSSSTELPFEGMSGNNVRFPGEDRDLFNIADLYNVGDGYLELMEIPVVEGRSFIEGADRSMEVMVSRNFLDKMAAFADWSDGAVGKSIIITEHSGSDREPFTICGVYNDFRLGYIGNTDARPSVMFYSSNISNNLLIKYHEQSPAVNKRVEEVIQGLLPNKEVHLYSYSTEMQGLYKEARNFRDSVMIGGLVALVISLIGLIGYTNDEMNRRRKETAIRKVNGATIMNIQSLFLKDITRFAIPALIVAAGAAAYVASKWQEQFNEKVALGIMLFLACGLLVLIIILSVVSTNCYRAATENPALSIKSE